MAEVLDPRIRRTRQMLHEALDQLLQSESIERISVSDITEKATLNRATFYDHYQDKFELLEGMVASRFQELLDKRGITFDGTCSGALMGMILAMCDYLAGLPGMSCPNRGQVEKYFESALIAVVRKMLLDGMKRHASEKGIAPELLAATVSGGIYGGASEWVRTPDRGPAEETAKVIFALVHPMMELV